MKLWANWHDQKNIVWWGMNVFELVNFPLRVHSFNLHILKRRYIQWHFKARSFTLFYHHRKINDTNFWHETFQGFYNWFSIEMRNNKKIQITHSLRTHAFFLLVNDKNDVKILLYIWVYQIRWIVADHVIVFEA